ncbi:MAG: 50S ribosomal protein L15 [Phycisphaerae bacterium]
MMISDVTSKAGRWKRRKRVGCGIGSGHGKTSTRGSKGMGQHSAQGPHPLSEGGQMPLFRRIPKRGFSNARFRTQYQVVNVGTLEERFDSGAKVTPASLAAAGLIHSATAPVKILGTGELSKKLDVEATSFSAAAAEKIAKAGGQAKTVE